MISAKKESATWNEAIEYIALNDESTIMNEREMCGYASVHAIAVVFGKSNLAVARAVVRYRKVAEAFERQSGEA